MRIKNNIAAINAQRQNGLVVNAKSKITEKLSSGYRINRAADDAAGLAISEKMRRQIKGLTRASENAQDGVSLVQVADGALSEMHDILQRINVLAVQSANDTNAAEDRGYLQQEVDQLCSEINRISRNTTFNEIKLFSAPPLVDIATADYSNARFDEKTNIGGKDYNYSKTMDFSSLTPEKLEKLNGKSFSVCCSQGCNQQFNFKFTNSGGNSINVTGAGTSRPSIDISIDTTVSTTGADIAKAIFDLAKSKESDIKAATSDVMAGSIPAGANAVYIGHANGVALDGAKLTFFAPGNDSNGKIKASDLDGEMRSLDLQVGAEQNQFITVNLYAINTGTLGIGDIDISTGRGAGQAIDDVKGGLAKISSYRSYYGATQNRLEHTIKNLDNVVENTTAAESRIRDTDMAKAMVEFSNLNILEQAGVSMMSQANQTNQMILSLLS